MKRRMLTDKELSDLRDAMKNPEYLARLAADAKSADVVEVDNPFRREVRPRRGRED